MIRSGALQTTLDLFMIVLIIIASYTLIFQSTQYWYFMLLIMFAYLYYLIKYRLTSNSSTSLQPIYHELPRTKKVLTKQEQQKRAIERSQNQYLRATTDKQNSFINRSRRAGDSYSRIINRQNDEQLKDFSFIKNKNQKKLMRQSFFKNNKGMNDSYLLNVQSNQERRNDRQQKVKEKINQCTKRYNQTLKSLNISYTQNLYSNVKMLCLSFTKELYEEHVNNFRQIIEIMEQVYNIRVICRGFIDLEKRLGQTKNFQDYRLEITLEQMLQKIIKGKGKQLSYPKSKLNEKSYINLRSPSVQPTSVAQMSPEIIKRKLQKLIIQQIKLNSYFSDQNKHWLSAVQVVNKVKSIGQQMSHQQQCFEYGNERYNIPQQQSERLLLIFNISRNKINDIVGDKDRALFFTKKSIMGWIRNEKSVFQIKETLNCDYGHPHLDLCVNKKDIQNYYCQYGLNNGYSLIYMYLRALIEHQRDFVRENRILINIIENCCREV